MKIAIIAPSPVPFTIGGAEKLAWGLQNWLNQNTPHQVELIKLPSHEDSFWNLIETYKAFYHLDLSYFDMIISMKYPAWMVQHNNHICYLLHRLRGLYDTYHFTHFPEEVEKGNKYVDAVMQYMEDKPSPNTLDCFFSILQELKNHEENIPQEYFNFPAPFIRKIIHYMDNFALSKERVRRFLSISNTVKSRKDYFPPNCPVEVVYPPSDLKKYGFGDYKYIFMASRLDSPKRIDLLIKAMSYIKSDLHLYIAGTGPQEQELKKLACKDKRITFLGFVNDETIEQYYKDSLVIPYFPYDEDYGLITIEAMMHRKPVITTTDAGGPTEFVKDNETGFVVIPTAQEIAKKIDYLFSRKEEAKRMGENAYCVVSKITWEKLAHSILGETSHATILAPVKRRKKITVTSTFPIFPPMGGGQARIYNLYKNIAKEYDVEIVSYTSNDQKPFIGEISDGLKEIRIPKSKQHQEKEWDMEKKVGIPITDIAMISLGGATPEYSVALESSIKDSDLVIISHPYLYNEASKYIKNKKFLYEAHNVESVMKKGMLPQNHYSRKLIDCVFEVEKACCQYSELILTCSNEDKETLNKVYGVSADKMLTIPNGVDVYATQFTSAEKRKQNKLSYGLQNECLGLFMGSWHNPNLEACEQIFKIAPKCPQVKFLLMGSQCAYFEQKKTCVPQNVGMLGMVNDAVKNKIFSVVDFALNPMLSGSGTNLKMFDYMAAGIPIISTAFGTRGIKEKEHFLITNIENMDAVINSFELNTLSEKIYSARSYVENSFAWDSIAQELCNRLKDII